MCRFS
jgi:hypothetical protein